MKKNNLNDPNRREFIKSTGVALMGSSIALNLGLPGSTVEHGKYNKDKANVLKVGLIGCGGRGSGAAAQALTADPDVILTAMGDVFMDRLEESYKSFNRSCSTKSTGR